MITTRTFDVAVCIGVLSDPVIFDAISEDGANLADIKVDVLNDIWLRIDSDDRLIGVVQLKALYRNCFEGHIQILPEHRKEHSRKAGESIISWLKANLSGFTITANAPVFCESVCNYLKAFGFEECGKIQDAWTKNGKTNDLITYSRKV